MQTLFSIARIAVGLGFLAAPKPVAHIFLMPFAPAAAIGCRMAGARDFVLGALLYLAPTRGSTTSDNKTINPSEHPLLPENGQSGNQIAQEHTERALIAGMVVDAVDVLSLLWCYLDGTLPIEAAATLGAGACFFFGLGVYCWHSVSTKHVLGEPT